MILVFCPPRRLKGTEADSEDSGEPRELRGCFTGATVFNSDQIDGLPDVTPAASDLDRAEATAESFVQANGAELLISEVSDGELGAYNRARGRLGPWWRRLTMTEPLFARSVWICRTCSIDWQTGAWRFAGLNPHALQHHLRNAHGDCVGWWSH